ncbi:amidase [Blastomyces dermatitidis ER-3]|uniref:Amidase n=1 Tax=Ajellomyces dermatitidis (strain ER-3 / ATCC MYA-2586) TaxID=559297 RepID=A0ABP2ERC4_AJEDR|nr:amidase [Blastomyces dermatitidis ER-3]EEQ86219.2 amidase [Blastomyces dermatitidis ER-3]
MALGCGNRFFSLRPLFGSKGKTRIPGSTSSSRNRGRFKQYKISPGKLAQPSLSIEEEVQITVGQVEYLLIPHPEVNFLDFESSNNDPTLALVYITKPGQTVSGSALRQFRTDTLDRDDVFQPEFFSNVIFYGCKEAEFCLEPDAREELATWNTDTWSCIEGNPTAKAAPGPYVFSRGRTWQPWRIYRDSITLDPPQAGTDGRVIVPSRCYYKPCKERPLDGARISVKDNIDIAGHKTTLCNRAWQDLYPAKTQHANCVQVLIDAGAVIVGKSKLQAMIMREEPLEAVEFTSPFNPRADGYQVPSGSSNGSAAGIGSYEWLDFSLGSDTNGSGRKPAQYNGCFSIRPSTGIMNTDGVVGQFPKFDMPVFFGRDLSRFSDFISVWYGDSPDLRKPSRFPVRILYPHDYLPTTNAEQSLLIDRFIQGLESALGVKREEISLAEEWKRDCPDGKDNDDIAEYLKLAGGYPYYHDSYHHLDDFRKDYKEKYGKAPFVHRAMHWQWDISKKITREERDMYWRRSEIYRQWLLDKIFKADSKDSISIMVFPIEEGRPNYRDVEPAPFSILSGYASLNMSPMMRAPELTTIVGEIPFNSIVTKQEELLPIAASVIGAPGM